MLLVRGKPDRQGLDAAGVTVTELRRALGGAGLGFRDIDEVFIDPAGNLRVTLNLSRSLRKREASRRTRRNRRLKAKRERETEE